MDKLMLAGFLFYLFAKIISSKSIQWNTVKSRCVLNLKLYYVISEKLIRLQGVDKVNQRLN